MQVIITDEVQAEGLQPLYDDPRIQVDVRLGLSPEQLHELIPAYDAIITRSGTKVDRALLDAATNLKIVARAGVGIDNVDVEYASGKGIVVVNAPFGNINSAAEHTMALLLSLCRNVTVANSNLKTGKWQRAPFTGHELKGRTMGIIGLGKVGGRVALRSKAFEMDVMAYDPYISEKRGRDLGVSLVQLEELVQQADVITVHTPLNAETRGMLHDEHFAQMKDGVIVVNCARGGIIDEKAMLKGLESGKVDGAAFDVWSTEPPESEDLRKLIEHERMVVTPHLGANTFEAQCNVAVDVSREIVRFLDGKPLESAVNIPRFDPDLMTQMKPFMGLSAQIGEFISQLAPANPSKITFSYNGQIAKYDCAPITVYGLAALLDRQTDQVVNMVNARMVAQEMGIEVEESRSTESESFSNLITLTLDSSEGRRIIAGTLFEGIPKIVKMRDFQTDFRPEPHMVVISYEDRPGLIGQIGSILGEASINIGNMNLGRRQKAGEAMVVLSVDSPVDEATLQKVAEAVDAQFIRAVHLPQM